MKRICSETFHVVVAFAGFLGIFESAKFMACIFWWW